MFSTNIDKTISLEYNGIRIFCIIYKRACLLEIKLFDNKSKVTEILWQEGDITSKKIDELTKKLVRVRPKHI